MTLSYLQKNIDFPDIWESTWNGLYPLLSELENHAEIVDQKKHWPGQNIQLLAESNVFRWFIPQVYGGLGWSEQQILAGYLALCQSCLTSTFILTQWNAAVRRIVTSGSDKLCQRLLPSLADGSTFATVGISHLSTSRQHLGRPILAATEAEEGFRLTGCSPWVTGAIAADWIVTGATLSDGRQILAVVDTTDRGVGRHPGMSLMALSSSCTDRVDFQDVLVPTENVIAGPVMNVMQAGSGSGGGTGGLQTSTLAVGLTLRAIEYLYQQAENRSELTSIADKFCDDVQPLLEGLFKVADGADGINLIDLRQQANSLVLRSTQAALQAAKGAGFVSGHPAGRWAREGMFFLVWSCPQSVMESNLCELAGLS